MTPSARLRVAAGLALLALVPAARADEPAAGPAPKKIAVCSITGLGAYRHSSIPLGEQIVQELADKTGAFTIAAWVRQPEVDVPPPPGPLPPDASEAARQQHAAAMKAHQEAAARFNAEAAERLAALTPEKLDAAGIDGVAFVSAYLVPMTAAQKDALAAWVARGHALISIHAGIDALAENPACVAMMGASFQIHHEQVPADLIKRAPDHPACRDLPDVWHLPMEEIYLFQEYTRGEQQDLWAMDHHPNHPEQAGHFPLVWCKPHGAGRVFYTALGHREDVWDTPEFRAHLRGGILWALGVE